MYKLRTIYNLIVVLMALYSFSNYSKAEDSFHTISKHTSGGINIRLRDEYWNTFQKQNTDTDRIYNFFLIKTRGWLDFKWDNLKIHVMGQGVKAFGFPENGAFGPGVLYFNASDQKTNPGNFQIGEAFIQYKGRILQRKM